MVTVVARFVVIDVRLPLAERSRIVFFGEAGGMVVAGRIGERSFLGVRRESELERSLFVAAKELAGRAERGFTSGLFSFVDFEDVVSFFLVGERQRGELKFDNLNLEFFLGDMRPE